MKFSRPFVCPSISAQIQLSSFDDGSSRLIWPRRGRTSSPSFSGQDSGPKFSSLRPNTLPARQRLQLWRCTPHPFIRLLSHLSLHSFATSYLVNEDQQNIMNRSKKPYSVSWSISTPWALMLIRCRCSDPLPAPVVRMVNGYTTWLLKSAEQCLAQSQKVSTLMRRRVLPSSWCQTCTTSSPPKTSQYVLLRSTCLSTPHAPHSKSLDRLAHSSESL